MNLRGFLLLGLALGLSACAGLPGLGSFLGQRISVNVGPEIPFPDTLTLQLDPSAGKGMQAADALLGRLGGGTLEERLGALLKQQSEPLRRQGAAALRQQLEQARLFGSVVEQGGNVALSVGVSRFGLAYDPASRQYQLVLDLSMTLSEPHLGVLWTGKRSAADLGAALRPYATRVNLAQLLSRPEGFNNLGQDALRDLGGQLLQELKQKAGQPL